MSAATETAAERRKRRILEKSEERMSRVMGAYDKEAGESLSEIPFCASLGLLSSEQLPVLILSQR
jgi:hypothetical protein